MKFLAGSAILLFTAFSTPRLAHAQAAAEYTGTLAISNGIAAKVANKLSGTQDQNLKNLGQSLDGQLESSMPKAPVKNPSNP